MAKISETALANSLDQFRYEVDAALTAITNQLLNKEYVQAAEGMNVLSQRMAKTNLAVRNVLIQGGHIDTE
jgi:hypothetical protein